MNVARWASVRPKPTIQVLALVAFTAYSLYVVVRHGYFGFCVLAWHDDWAMQMLLDLTIALCLVGGWLRRDAQSRGMAAWPYLVALPLVGSISPLVYLAHRRLRAGSR